MSQFWRLLTGTGLSGLRRDRRPRLAHRPGVTTLEIRRLNAVSMGIPAPPDNLPAVPAVTVSPKFLFPSDGRYVPVKISGGLTSTYAMDLDGAYAVFPKPAYTAQLLSQLPLPDPTSTAPVPTGVASTYTATIPGSKTAVSIPYTLTTYIPPAITPPSTPKGLPYITPGTGLGVYTVTLPGYKYPATFGFVWQGSVTKNAAGAYVVSPQGIYQVAAKVLPVSPYEQSVILSRLNGRRGPADVVLQVTDQYRQDEPRLAAPISLYAAPSIEPFGNPLFEKGAYVEQISVPTAMAINRSYTYSFATHLQALKHPGTSGRQYIVNVSSEDADDGGSVNTAVIVPKDA